MEKGSTQKRPVYKGYEEYYLTGKELTAKFANAFERFGSKYNLVSKNPIDLVNFYPRIRESRTYRVFIKEPEKIEGEKWNIGSCMIMDSVTDKKLKFFIYTTDNPWGDDSAIFK